MAEPEVEGWLPEGKNNESGWRLDIVSLLAVIGESSMAENSQAMTASWLCCLPRIIPAPQVLLKPTRPTRMPHTNACIVGVKNGIIVDTLNYFPNIIHPIDDLPAYAFKVYHIRHSEIAPKHRNSVASSNGISNTHDYTLPVFRNETTTAESENMQAVHRGPTPKEKLPPHVPVKITSPLNILSIFSCVLTCALFGVSVYDRDGVACLALVSISMVSSIVGYASLWSPQLMKRTSGAYVPPGDVVIRTRRGAFVVVKCDENVARELYTGTEECIYMIKNVRIYRALVGVATFLLMVSVVLLGNCNFNQQAAIGASYIVLNGLYWGASLVPKGKFWDMKLYEYVESTPSYCKDAEKDQDKNSPDGQASFTRTMWYAIRETEEIGWVRSSNAAPQTPEWDDWLKLALAQVQQKKAAQFQAVAAKDTIVGQTDTSSKLNGITVPGGQHVPGIAIPRDD